MVQLQEKQITLPNESTYKPKILWESLPYDYILPDDPVESILQPLLASGLTEALDLAGFTTSTTMIASNMALTLKMDGKTVVKAPDWFFVHNVVPFNEGMIRRSYTPYREGPIPAIVMEFLSDSDGGEYSKNNSFPYGKFWFYEQIIKVPLYVIFEPNSGLLEVYQLNSEGIYEIISPDEHGRYFMEFIGLYLGKWYGRRLQETNYWLRWWDNEGNLLLWGPERIEIEKQRVESAEQRVESEKKRAESAEEKLAKLSELMRKAGLEIPENLES